MVKLCKKIILGGALIGYAPFLFADVASPEPLLKVPVIGEETIGIIFAGVVLSFSLIISFLCCVKKFTCEFPEPGRWYEWLSFTVMFYLPYLLFTIAAFREEFLFDIFFATTIVAFGYEFVYLICSCWGELKNGKRPEGLFMELGLLIGVYGAVFFWRLCAVRFWSSDISWIKILLADTFIILLFRLFQIMHRRKAFMQRFCLLMICTLVCLPVIAYGTFISTVHSNDKFQKMLEKQREHTLRSRTSNVNTFQVKSNAAEHVNHSAVECASEW